MKLRQDNSTEVAAAKASISSATAYRIESDPRLPFQKKQPRSRRRPDSLEHIFETEVVPLLKAAPGIRAVAVYDEMRHCQVVRSGHFGVPVGDEDAWLITPAEGVSFSA